jgi:hypothetical protein
MGRSGDIALARLKPGGLARLERGLSPATDERRPLAPKAARPSG